MAKPCTPQLQLQLVCAASKKNENKFIHFQDDKIQHLNCFYNNGKTWQSLYAIVCLCFFLPGIEIIFYHGIVIFPFVECMSFATFHEHEAHHLICAPHFALNFLLFNFSNNFHGIDFELFHFTSFGLCVCVCKLCFDLFNAFPHWTQSMKLIAIRYCRCMHSRPKRLINTSIICVAFLPLFDGSSFVIKWFFLSYFQIWNEKSRKKHTLSNGERHRVCENKWEGRKSAVFYLIDSFVQKKKSIYFKITLLFFKSNVQSTHKKTIYCVISTQAHSTPYACSFWENVYDFD